MNSSGRAASHQGPAPSAQSITACARPTALRGGPGPLRDTHSLSLTLSRVRLRQGGAGVQSSAFNHTGVQGSSLHFLWGGALPVSLLNSTTATFSDTWGNIHSLSEWWDLGRTQNSTALSALLLLPLFSNSCWSHERILKEALDLKLREQAGSLGTTVGMGAAFQASGSQAS